MLKAELSACLFFYYLIALLRISWVLQTLIKSYDRWSTTVVVVRGFKLYCGDAGPDTLPVFVDILEFATIDMIVYVYFVVFAGFFCLLARLRYELLDIIARACVCVTAAAERTCWTHR